LSAADRTALFKLIGLSRQNPDDRMVMAIAERLSTLIEQIEQERDGKA
jgi:hypothetical protein